MGQRTPPVRPARAGARLRQPLHPSRQPRNLPAEGIKILAPIVPGPIDVFVAQRGAGVFLRPLAQNFAALVAALLEGFVLRMVGPGVGLAEQGPRKDKRRKKHPNAQISGITGLKSATARRRR